MSQRPQMPRAPKPQPKPKHYHPYHHHYWWDDYWYDDYWWWDDDYYDWDYRYRIEPTPKHMPRATPPTPKVKSMPKATVGYECECDWSNTLAYQAGYNDGFMAGVEYQKTQETTVTTEPETPTEE